MNSSEKYTSSNQMQKKGAEMVIREYFPEMDWCDCDRVLDVGCGPGDLTVNMLTTKIPCQWSEIIGMDVNPTMIESARKRADAILKEKLTFVQGDIAAPEPPLNETFDKIVSFYCLHWIRDHTKAARNMITMLKPGGEALLAFIGYCPIYEAYNAFAKSERWGAYMKNYERYISPFHNSIDPCKEVKQIYENVGFEIKKIHKKNVRFMFDTLEQLKKGCEAVNPFLKEIPKEMHEDYLEDFMEITLKNNLVDDLDAENIEDKASIKNLKVNYDLIIVYLIKE